MTENKGEWIECTKSGMPLTEYGRMTGEKWYGFKCSRCKFIYKGNALIESPFCQKCGADMRRNTKRKGTPIEGNNESYNCENWIP